MNKYRGERAWWKGGGGGGGLSSKLSSTCMYVNYFTFLFVFYTSMSVGLIWNYFKTKKKKRRKETFSLSSLQSLEGTRKNVGIIHFWFQLCIHLNFDVLEVSKTDFSLIPNTQTWRVFINVDMIKRFNHTLCSLRFKTSIISDLFKIVFEVVPLFKRS